MPPGFIVLGDNACGDRTAGRMPGLGHDRLWPACIIGGRQFGQDIIRDLLDAGALNELDGRDLDPKRCFEPVQKRDRHQRIEPQLAKRPRRIDRFGDAQGLHRLLTDKGDEQFAAFRSARFCQLRPYGCCIRAASLAAHRRTGRLVDGRRPLRDRRPQCLGRQWFQRQSFDCGGEPTVVLIDGDIGGEDLRIAVLRLPSRAMHPNLPGTESGGAAETLDADRQVGAPQPVGRLREVAIGIDQRRIEVEAGIEQRRMQPGLAVDGKMGRQPNACQNLAAAPLQHLDPAKRSAVFQSKGAQGFHSSARPGSNSAHRCLT